MTLVDRFICRREGHVPAVEITKFSGVIPKTYVTRCLRCGKAIEVDMTGRREPKCAS